MLTIAMVGEAAELYRIPDIVWNGFSGDLALNDLFSDDGPGDLQAGQGLASQVVINLMTDRRVEPEEVPSGMRNRGWPGDSFDVIDGETPIGSRLWLLRRAAIVDGLDVRVEDYVREALQPLIEQAAAVSLAVTVTTDPARGRVDFTTALYGADGSAVYQQKFALLWSQIDGMVG